MSANRDLLDTFAEGEIIDFEVLMKRRDGTAIDTVGAKVTLVVSVDEDRDTPLFQLTLSANPTEVVLIDAPTARYKFKPSAANAALMSPEVIYHFDIWTDTSADGVLHQVNGSIRLKQAGPRV